MISQTLLSNVVHGATTGTYAGLTPPLYSVKFPGDGYRGDKHGVHTFAYFVDSSFVGSIVIQASLATAPTNTDWVTLDTTRITVAAPGPAVAATRTYNGNILWIRVAVESFTAGTIVKVQYSN
jgi:hypothetical protein